MTGRRILFGVAVAAVLLPRAALGQSGLGGLGDTRDVAPLPGLPDRSERTDGLAIPRPPLRTPSGPEGGPALLMVEGVRFEGNTVFSDAELAAKVATLVGRAVSLEDLEAARLLLTQTYIDAGYVSSGVLIPAQDAQDGIILFQVVEGRLAGVEPFGEDIGTDIGFDGQLVPDYVEKRLSLPGDQPLNVEDLRERFGILLEDPIIERLRGDLRPGAAPGDAILDVEVFTRDPFEASVSLNNHQTVSTGALGFEGDLRFYNLTGYGDISAAAFEISEGRIQGLGRFEVPVTANNITPFLELEASDSEVIERPFDELEIEADFWRITGGVRWPVYRTTKDTVALVASFDHKRSATTLLDLPFPPPGVVDDTLKASIFRLSQEWVRRRPDQVFALRSTFSLGVDLFNSTEGIGDAADGTFFAWLGQAQYVQRIDDDVRVVARAQARLSPDALLVFEQIGIGGIDTVRGYRENALVEDNAVIASLEVPVALYDLAVPDFTPAGFESTIEFAPFIDYGVGWSKGDGLDGRTTLIGVGAALRWSPHPQVDLEVAYGYPIKDLDRGVAEEDLTDEAVYFNVTIATN